MSACERSAGSRLNELLGEAGLASLEPKPVAQFELYLSLFVRWNARMNLSAIRDEESILSRHFVESIACAFALPLGVSTLLDFGSGGGLPGIPIALCRPEIEVTLAESQGKKAAFLQEAVRALGIAAKVHARRAETLNSLFDSVVLRAVDRMSDAVHSATGLVAANGWIGLMTTSEDLAKLQDAAGSGFSWREPVSLPGGERRILALGQRGSGHLDQDGA